MISNNDLNLKSQIVTSNNNLNLKSQFATIKIKEFKNSHDRFIIIDSKTVYHFGASLKDLGKKWFAFSKMDIGAIDMLTRLEGMKVGGVKQ